MLPRRGLRYAFFAYIVDQAVTAGALFIARIVRVSLPIGNPQPGLDTVPPFVVVLVAAIWTVSFINLSVYNSKRINRKDEIQQVVVASPFSLFLLAGALYFSVRGISRLYILYFYAIDLLLLIGWRLLAHLYFSLTPTPPKASHRIVLVGANEAGRQAAEILLRQSWSGIEPLGFLDERSDGEVAGLPIIGSPRDIRAIAESLNVQEVVIALPSTAHEQINQVVTDLDTLPTQIRIVPDTLELALHRPTADSLGRLPVVNLRDSSLTSYQIVIKRLFDFFLTLLILVLASPALVTIAAAIKLDSKGPVFFNQNRVGQNGSIFQIHKFRSMFQEVSEDLHRQQIEKYLSGELDSSTGVKLVDDPRVTRVGRFIRKTSLDELPQLFNVLKGEMSLVGPRPIPVYEVDRYLRAHRERLAAPPGITGLWQVNGRGVVSFEEQIQMDIEYVRNQSLWLDIRLLALTIPAVLSGRGAG